VFEYVRGEDRENVRERMCMCTSVRVWVCVRGCLYVSAAVVWAICIACT
jgi:hypothetical protein